MDDDERGGRSLEYEKVFGLSRAFELRDRLMLMLMLLLLLLFSISVSVARQWRAAR